MVCSLWELMVLYFSFLCPHLHAPNVERKKTTFLHAVFLYTKSPMMFIQYRGHPLFMKRPTKTFLGCPPVNFLHKLLPFLYLCSDNSCWLKKETSFHCPGQVSSDPSFVLIYLLFLKCWLLDNRKLFRLIVCTTMQISLGFTEMTSL